MTHRSSLARFAPQMQDAHVEHAKAAAAAAWHRDGILLVHPDWLHGWADQQQVKIIAEKMYGKRKQGAENDPG